MAELLDYVKWRGDLTVKQDEINKVDCLIFAWLSYIDMQGIVPSDNLSCATIKKTAEVYLKNHDVDKIAKESTSFTKTAGIFLRECARSERFSDMGMFCHRNEIVPKINSQFSAVTVKADSKTYVVVFRGTDEHLIGWREDFNMSFMSAVPAQQKALDYLKEIGSLVKGKIYVTGHSKGGNLAVYAACKAPQKIRARIQKVYDFDGPGFMEESILGDGRNDIFPKTEWFTPEESVVGAIMNDLSRFAIVKSSAKGVMQHDAGTWQVLGKDFVTANEIKAVGKIFDETMRNWLRELSDDDKKQFTDALFKMLSANDAFTLDDIKANHLKTFTGMFKKYLELDSKERTTLKKCADSFIKEAQQSMKKENKLKNPVFNILEQKKI